MEITAAVNGVGSNYRGSQCRVEIIGLKATW